MERALLVLTGLNGFAAVALGAFGAHGLEARLAALNDAAERISWWETAAHYHLVHTLALGLSAHLVTRTDRPWPKIAGGAFTAGIVLFSGSLYAMTLTGARWLGAVTPLGGLCLLAGWLAVTVAALGLRR